MWEPAASEDGAEEGEWDGEASLGGFATASAPVAEVQLSECRELVFVSSGISGKIAELNRRWPELCWEYPSTELVISAQMLGLAQAGQRDTTDEREVFGLVSRCLSPVDFFMQPKGFAPTLRKLHEVIQGMAEELEAGEPLTNEQLFKGVPCLIGPQSELGDGRRRRWASLEWRRGRLLEDAGETFDGTRLLLVRSVDEGWEAFVPSTLLRPLPQRLARLPPLALHCRVAGVDINDLEAHKVEAFQRTIEQDCRRQIRLLVLGFAPTPIGEQFLCKVFHPTVLGQDIGSAYLPRAPIPVLPGQHTSHKGRIRNPQPGQDLVESDYGVTSDDESEGRPAFQPHLLSFPRMPKPPRRMVVAVSFVGTCNSFFVQSLFGRQKAEAIAAELGAETELERLPERGWARETPCVLEVGGGRRERGLVREVEAGGEWAWVQSVDVGRVRRRRLSELWCLPSRFADPPMALEARLDELCTELALPQETRLLEALLGARDEWMAEFPSRQSPPFKIALPASPVRAASPPDGSLTQQLLRLGRLDGVRRSWDLVPLPYLWRGRLPVPRLTLPPHHALPNLPHCITFRKGALAKGDLNQPKD